MMQAHKSTQPCICSMMSTYGMQCLLEAAWTCTIEGCHLASHVSLEHSYTQSFNVLAPRMRGNVGSKRPITYTASRLAVYVYTCAVDEC